MMWQNARVSVALLARPFKPYKWLLLQLRCRSSKNIKNSKSEKMKLVRKEEHLFFGKLIETQKQKSKRLKLEAAGKASKSAPSAVNSEFAWIVGTSKKLNILSVQKEHLQKSNVNFNSEQSAPHNVMARTNLKNSSTQKVDTKSQNIAKDVIYQQNPSSGHLLPKVVIQHLLEFPIFETTKISKDQCNSDDFKIMTVSPLEDKACLKYPSVTKILTATMSKEAKDILEKWKIKMIEKLGLRGFEIYQAELFEDGKLLHSIIMSYLINKPYEIPNKVKQSFLSLNEVLKDIDNVRAIESHVIHSRLMYRGIVDCIANYRGDLCLIDWKKSDKAKDTIAATYDAPIQLASYIGAVNADSKYPFQIKKGLIVVAYTNGEPAKVHEIKEDSLKLYWKLWLQRLQNYHISLDSN